MGSLRIVRRIRAPRAAVYRALLDADAVAAWRVPAGMTSVVHEFDVREGGSFRVSLTYVEPTSAGKTVTTTLVDVDGGTDVVVVHEGLPRGVSVADNETGTRMSLDNLATLVESS